MRTMTACDRALEFVSVVGTLDSTVEVAWIWIARANELEKQIHGRR